MTPDAVTGLLRPGMVVYIPGTSGESALFTAALRSEPDAAQGVHFLGVWLPGINRVDYAGLHPEARSTAFFISRDWRASFADGRIAFRPMTYLGIYHWLAREAEIDLALLQCAPADAQGRFSLGAANDFSPAILDRARRIVVHANPRMPVTRGAATLAAEQVYGVVEASTPLLAADAGRDATFDAIGRRIAGIIPNGATIEIGIGRVQSVLNALTGHRDLRFHTGAITTPLLHLVEAGALAEAADAVVTGVAYGEPALYAFLADDPRVRFAPVGETHDPATLRRIEPFVAINSVIEVDLLGQANAETIDGRQMSGTGGLTDFMRGARLSRGGFSILALPSTAADGRASRIVAAFPAGATVSVPRADVDVVVTEHGMADLRGLDLDARAAALIAIAAPAFREPLARAWGVRRTRI